MRRKSVQHFKSAADLQSFVIWQHPRLSHTLSYHTTVTITARETQHPNTDDNTQGFGGALGNWDLVMLGSVEELVKVFNTNIETGLTDDQVQERRGPKWEVGEYSQDHDGRRMKNVVLVRRNGTVVEVSPIDLVYGDIVEVKVKHPVPMGWWDSTGEYNDDYFGERIPADIRIIESDGFQVQ